MKGKRLNLGWGGGNQNARLWTLKVALVEKFACSLLINAYVQGALHRKGRKVSTHVVHLAAKNILHVA